MNDMSMAKLITHLINRSRKATKNELIEIIEQIAAAPFATGLLAADEPLWGSFWHFDVISPGYRLPAVELALLRATRLDGHWSPDTTVNQFLATLRQVIHHPRAGIWMMPMAQEPCVIFAAEHRRSTVDRQPSLATVIWYCASTGNLHAGYRTPIDTLYVEGAVEQRPPEFELLPQKSTGKPPNWLASAVEHIEINAESSLTVRLDTQILWWRARR